MNNELPKIFDRLPRPAASPELRRRVLSAVEREIGRRRKPRWERAIELGVAACLALGVGLNVWQWQSTARRPQRPLRSPLAAHDQQEELIDAVATITDAATARMVVNRLVAARGQPRGADRPVASDAKNSLKN